MLVESFWRASVMARKIESISVINPRFLSLRGIGVIFSLMVLIIRVHVVTLKIYASLTRINVLLDKLGKLMSTITFSHKVAISKTYRIGLIVHKLLIPRG